jgi:predicted DNA-binding antitoxin AbrB/MazE fold protein
MVLSVRAVYQNGQLRLLDAVSLDEGQAVVIDIRTGDETPMLLAEEINLRLRAAGLLMNVDVPADAQALTDEERDHIGRLFMGDRPSEALIDEDRGLY